MLRKGSEFLLGLFYANEETLVYDNIKLSHRLSKEAIRGLKSISLKFLGPLFMTRELHKQKVWKIDYIETSLTAELGKSIDEALMQSMACLNSSRKTAGYTTNLFSFVGSPYTEDLTMIYDRLDKYIHPSIAQGKIVNQEIYGKEFDGDEFIVDELERGINLIEHNLGSPRRIYWEEKKAYSPVAIIKRTKIKGRLESDLYTYDLDEPLRLVALEHIPSFYFMGILPDYYEKRMNDTLTLFGVEGLYSNIINIKVSNPDTTVLYIEEFSTNGDGKLGYGLILIPHNENMDEAENIFYYKKQLRTLLDKNKDFESSVVEINSKINPFDNWSLNSNESLKRIEGKLDRKE